MQEVNASKNPDRLLTDEEVAYRLGIPIAKAKQLIQRRRLPIVKWGRLNRVKESDLNAYITTLWSQPVNAQRTPLQEHIYALTAACVHVATSADVVFQDAAALDDFKQRLPDMVQAIHKAFHVVMASDVVDDGEHR